VVHKTTPCQVWSRTCILSPGIQQPKELATGPYPVPGECSPHPQFLNPVTVDVMPAI